VRKTLARNTAYNAAGRLWEAASGLVLTAYVIERIGVASWGLWAFVSVFTGYVGLLDFGVGSGFAKYVAEHAARCEDDALSAVVSTGFFFYLILGCLLVAVGWPCIDALVDALVRLGPQRARDFGSLLYTGDARFLLRWGLVLFAVSNCVAAFTAVQTGLQRMGITNVLSFATSLVKIACTVFFIERGHGVRGLLYTNAITLALFALAGVIVAFKLIPELRVSPFHVTRGAFSRLFGFGWRAQIAKLSNLIMFQTDKLIVAFVFRYLGMVGLYDLGVNLANKMRQLPLLLLSALVPAASDLDAREEHDRLRRLYLRSTKYVAAVTLPLVAFTVGAAGPLMRTWMGEKRDLALAAWVCRIIAFGYLANILPGAGISVALGKGRADLQMKAGAIATVANLVLTVALVYAVWPFGNPSATMLAIPVATTLSMFLSCAWFLSAAQPVLGAGAAAVLGDAMLWPAVASAPGFALCLAGDRFTSGMVERAPNGLVLLVLATAMGVSYAALMRLTPFWDAFDHAFLADTLGLRRIPGFRRLLSRRRRHG